MYYKIINENSDKKSVISFKSNQSKKSVISSKKSDTQSELDNDALHGCDETNDTNNNIVEFTDVNE